jgi:hypothetical protein
MGRPKLRWLKEAERDLREMKVKILEQKAVDREECVCLIKEDRHLEIPRA